MQKKRIETMPMSSGPERTDLINKRFLYGQEKFLLMDVLKILIWSRKVFLGGCVAVNFFPIVFGYGNVF